MCDVDMTTVYQDMGFEDKDGGVWKQGFSLTTSDGEWEGRTLKSNHFQLNYYMCIRFIHGITCKNIWIFILVFVVPHSHNDPGWIKTYESYFNDQTRHILDNIVDYLSKDSRRYISYKSTPNFMSRIFGFSL